MSGNNYRIFFSGVGKNTSTTVKTEFIVLRSSLSGLIASFLKKASLSIVSILLLLDL